MLDLLLVNSPLHQTSSKPSDDYLPPLGLAYIASYLQSKGKNVEVLDSVNIGLGIVEIVDYIRTKQPKYVGINIFSINHNIVRKICESLDGTQNLFIGGNLTKFFYSQISEWKISMKCYVIIGDGEKIVNAIIDDNIEEKPFFTMNEVSVYKVDKNSIYFSQDLDEYVVDRRFCQKGYKNVHGVIEEAIVTSRGCPFNCAYCGSARSINLEMSIRKRSIEHISNELSEIENYTKIVTSIRILDDLFLVNRNSIRNAIDLFNMHSNFKWRAMAHVSSLKDSTDLFSELYESGCEELFLGIESGSEEIRKFIHKEGSISDIISVTKQLLIAKIQVKAYFILGFPNETEDDMEKTYQLARELHSFSTTSGTQLRTTVFEYRPYHGTELFIYMRKNGIPYSDLYYEGNTIGKEDFKFTAGNVSKTTYKVLKEYVSKMYSLNEGNIL